MKIIQLNIDGQDIRVPEGTNLVEAAREVGIEIPTLCYAKELEIVSACRLCIVEIEGKNKFMTACSTEAEEGMCVRTETPEIVKIRKQLIQLILDNHPNDCLTCEKAGNCDLQRYAYKYGVDFREHEGDKRGNPLKRWSDTSSPYILRDESKCILCGKCIRTCSEVDDRQVLSFASRGFDTRVIADLNQSLEESNCVSCGRCVAVCPVGALIDRRSYGKGRVWEMDSEEVDCMVCDHGCTMEVLKSKGEVVSVKPGKPSRGRPLCLKGRLRTEFELKDRPATPYVKIEEDGKNKFVEASWQEVLDLENVIDKLKKLED